MSEEKITVIRARHDKDNPYFASSRATAQNRNLSWEARGVLWYLLSKPSDWEIVPKDLEQQCGKAKVYGIIKELKDAGYLIRERTRDDKGKFVWGEYRVYEHPSSLCEPFPENPEMGNPEMAKSDMDKPETETPFMENPPQHIKDSTELKTDIEETDKKDSAPPGAQPAPVSDSQSEVSLSVEEEKPAPPTHQQLTGLIALYSFGIEKVDGVTGSRAGKIASWLKKREVTEAKIIAFYGWYDTETEKAERPRDPIKFQEWFLKFETSKTPPSIPFVPPTSQPNGNTDAFLAAQPEPAPLAPPDESVNTTVGKYGKTALEAWNAAYSQLEHTYDRATFMTWIQDARLIQVDVEGAFVIEAKNDYAMSVCRDRLYRAIHRTVADCYGDEVRLEFVSRTPAPADPLEKMGERMKRAKAAERERLAREQGDAA